MHGYGSKDLAAAFRTVRKNTIQVADDIPDDKYDFVAAPGVMSVRTMLCHLAFSPIIQEDMHRVKRVTTLKGFDFAALHARMGAEVGKLRSRPEIVALLTFEGERLATWLDSLSNDFLAETFTDNAGSNPRTRFESLLGIKEHEMHHRGQLMLMERLVGVVPHLTRQREEMRARMKSAAAAAH